MNPTPITNDVDDDQLAIGAGTIVDVERDDGEIETRVALGSPVTMCGTLCVKVKELGLWALSRVRPAAYQVRQSGGPSDLRVVFDARDGMRSLAYVVVHAPSGTVAPGEWTLDVAQWCAISAATAQREQEGGGR